MITQTLATAEDFERALDTNPYDWLTRFAYADWLEERDDPLAAGYRALARYNRCPTKFTWRHVPKTEWLWNRSSMKNGIVLFESHLPYTWFSYIRTEGSPFWYPTRPEAERIAAEAYTRLSPRTVRYYERYAHLFEL